MLHVCECNVSYLYRIACDCTVFYVILASTYTTCLCLGMFSDVVNNNFTIFAFSSKAPENIS